MSCTTLCLLKLLRQESIFYFAVQCHKLGSEKIKASDKNMYAST